jgi:hypothetical protein
MYVGPEKKYMLYLMFLSLRMLDERNY